MRRILKPALYVVVGGAAVVLALSAVSQWIPDDKVPADRHMLSPGERVTVEVLNAGGVDGMARIATDYLRTEGFDVVSVGNASSFDQDSTVVIDRAGSLQKAAAVADALGVRSVTNEPDEKLFVDVTVRLGSDWTAPATRPGEDQGDDGLLDWLRRIAGGRDRQDGEGAGDGREARN